MTTWRQHLHRHPEFGFEEHQTAAFVAEELRGFGFDEVTTGVGGTGVVGTLRAGTGNRAIGFRADMDALRIEEQGARPYRSQAPGVMHACGHDGHTAMLLGAAKHLAEHRNFNGTIRFIFQPAEEWGQGMQAMLDDGLLTRFPMEEAYGLHNMPGMEVGSFATRPGAIMAAEDNFEIEITGSGGHASQPHVTSDALLAGCATVTALQSIVSRGTDPAELAVVSATEIRTDGTVNAIASNARILGDCRSFSPEISKSIETAMERIVAGTAAAHGCAAKLSYKRVFVPTINDPEMTQHAIATARALGPTDANTAPMGGSEDFARLTAQIPGNFIFIGNGDSAALHHPSYDFNDAALPHGAGYFARLARRRLPE
ncbi:M20 aminoacylase family protein [Candidatus Rhodobacter oscarellae]|nr:M20 aminoacylase family protein [Candidatus Rhodobacter lobularis]